VAHRVVVAEDYYLVREGLQRMLESEPRITYVAGYETADALFGAIDVDRPDVILSDIRMPPDRRDEGIALAERLRATHPAIGVLVLSNYAAPRHAMRLFAGGAQGRGYLLKERVASRETIVRAIVDVAAGGSVVDPDVVQALVDSHRTSGSAVDALTDRELEVLSLVAEGDSNERIAQRLVLTKGAVEKHINGIFSKLGLSNDPGVSSRVRATLLYLGQDR
jgi:DNA-binding NarL/FixJ family response regulator